MGRNGRNRSYFLTRVDRMAEIIKRWGNKSRFDTLNEALDSINGLDLIALWPLGTNVNYSETQQVIVGEGKKERLISVYRDNKGMYEGPVTYLTQI